MTDNEGIVIRNLGGFSGSCKPLMVEWRECVIVGKMALTGGPYSW